MPYSHALPRLVWWTFTISTITQGDGLYSRYRGKLCTRGLFVYWVSHTNRNYSQSFNYRVDRLFDSQISTEEIYENLVVDLVPFAWNGGIGTLFAYGQTGSGKTFTISRLEQLVAESLMDGSL